MKGTKREVLFSLGGGGTFHPRENISFYCRGEGLPALKLWDNILLNMHIMNPIKFVEHFVVDSECAGPETHSPIEANLTSLMFFEFSHAPTPSPRIGHTDSESVG